MKIAITGARGQLGRELCRELRDAAVPLDRKTLDVTDSVAVDAVLLDLRPSAVINCAAYTAVDRAESEPEVCYAANVASVGHLAGVCCRLDCPLVQISTDYVFGGDGERSAPYREVDQPSPLSVYGAAKLAGEQAARRHAKHLVVRTCGLYAPPEDQRASHFVKSILRSARAGTNLRVVADQHCTPSYVPHVARAILFLLNAAQTQRADWGIYHVTSGGATTWFQFACEILRLAEIDSSPMPITTDQYGAAACRPRYSVLDTTKYHRLAGPELPHWQAALRDYVKKSV